MGELVLIYLGMSFVFYCGVLSPPIAYSNPKDIMLFALVSLFWPLCAMAMIVVAISDKPKKQINT